jgi:uncharacterized glyoxalase superfamily protein PhnB
MLGFRYVLAVAVNRFQGSIPILSVKDVAASIRYYVDRLGFKKHWEWGDPPTFAAVTRDAVEIYLCKDKQGHPGTWVYVAVEDVDALYAELLASGAEIRQPPTNLPWHMRELNVADLDGHRLRFGTPSSAPPSGTLIEE